MYLFGLCSFIGLLALIYIVRYERGVKIFNYSQVSMLFVWFCRSWCTL
ncbi:hypothetical protein Hanom_Chr05g00468411 [Helianthus anomalus]